MTQMRFLLPIALLASIWCLAVRELPGQADDPEQKVQAPNRLKLKVEWRRTRVLDISRDGRYLLTAKVGHQPVTLYDLPLSGGTIRRSSRSESKLSLVVRQNGKEIEHLALADAVAQAQFVPGQDSAVLELHEGRVGFNTRYVVWQFYQGRVRELCPEEAAIQTGRFRVSRDGIIFGSTSGITFQGEASLYRADLPLCSEFAKTTLMPDDPPGKKGLGSKSWSSNGEMVAYTVKHYDPIDAGMLRNQYVYVRNLRDFRYSYQIECPDGWNFSDLALSPDGKFLAVSIHGTGLPWDARTNQRVLLYDVEQRKLIRNLEANGQMGVAISPNNMLVATAQRAVEVDQHGNEKRVQGRIRLHDLRSGELAGQGVYPWVDRPRKDPFVGNVRIVGFTPDSKELITHTYDTRIWSIEYEN